MTDAIAEDGSKPSLLSTFINIFTAPSEAFTQIRQRPSKLVPLAAVMLSMGLVLAWYFQMLDFDWYIDEVLAQTGAEGDELEQARNAMQSLSRNSFMTLGLLGSCAAIVAVNLLQAMYLSLASALGNDRLGFGYWFSLSCWCGMPALLSVLAIAVNITLSSNGQLSPFDMDPLALPNLGVPVTNPSMLSLLNSINLPMVWGLVLLMLGYRQWTERSLGFAVAIVGLPYVLVYGVWAYFILG